MRIYAEYRTVELHKNLTPLYRGAIMFAEDGKNPIEIYYCIENTPEDTSRNIESKLNRLAGLIVYVGAFIQD